jgi:phosphatidylinositol 4-kinase
MTHKCSDHFTSQPLRSLSNWKSDRARALASQLASKCYFSGEVAGSRLATGKSKLFTDRRSDVFNVCKFGRST